jgi:hypothetical protein
VLFVFDGSASMRAADERFKQAVEALQTLLRDLAGDASEELRLGLWAYGMQTPTDPNPPNDPGKVYYDFTKSHEDFPNNLTTPAGRDALARMMGNNRAFRGRFPHPDRDLKKIVSLSRGNADALLAEPQFRAEQCLGSTPLYYSIHEALRNGFSGDFRHEESASADRRHFGRRTCPMTFGEACKWSAVGRGDERSRPGVSSEVAPQPSRYSRDRSSVWNPGPQMLRMSNIERLLQLERDHPKFDVRRAGSAKEIYRSIRESFP